MMKSVELPVWLLVLILLFAAVTASTHLLFPSVRWFFRRRAERLVAELNKRLDRPIQPFKLLRRQDMIQRVIYDPEVVRAVADYAAENGVREDVAFEKARDYAREIVPSFSASAYFGIAIKVARWVATKLFDVRLHHVDEEAISKIDPEATVVFVMNHRSNFDYVLVTYLAATQSALSYAVGEWARVWPLRSLIRAMGAYFIRRRSRTVLYRKVLSTYVQRATEAGVTQAVFPEGGLSRDGLIGEPKLGILSYIVEGWKLDGRDVVFVPIALNYDRVVEDRVLIAAGRSGRRRFRASVPEGIHFTLRYIRRRIMKKVGRFGAAAVTFGHPVSLKVMAKQNPSDLVNTLAERLNSEIRAAVPIVSVPLILAAIVQRPDGATVDDIAEAMGDIRPNQPGDAPDFALSSEDKVKIKRELDILVLRQILQCEEDFYSPAEADLVAYYANSISQHLSADAAKAIPMINAVATPPKT
ncbi:MAG: 1-acyl-sn-glycerol-3-phosphate acyltransferase [Boseongicola sp.]